MKRSKTYRHALNESRANAAKRLVDIAVADNPGMSKTDIYTEVGKDLGMAVGACKTAYSRGNGCESGKGNGGRSGTGLKAIDKIVMLSNEFGWGKKEFQKHRKTFIQVLGVSDDSYDKAVLKNIDWAK